MAAEVSPDLARLWRLPAESRLGRHAKLDVEQVVRAAVGLADLDGLAGVTLPNIAKSLGVTPMSLYRYVGSKDELFVLIGDFAIGPPIEISTTAEEWRAGLRQYALAQAERTRLHPWLAHLPIAGPPRGPNGIGWLDAGLRVLRDTGLDWAAKVGIVAVVGGYVRSTLQLTLDLEHGRRGTDLNQEQTERDYAQTLAGLVEPSRFPEAAKLFGSGLFESPPDRPSTEPEDHDFIFGLDLILDGVTTTIDRIVHHRHSTSDQ